MATASKPARTVIEVRAPERMHDKNLVEAALAKFAAVTGGDAKTFANDVIPGGCDEKTLYRWRYGISRLNARRRRWFVEYLKTPLVTREDTEHDHSSSGTGSA